MTVKILHTSDWHVGRRIRGRDRSEEHRSVLAELVAIAAGAEVQLVVVAGDVFDASAPTPAAEQIVWRGLLDLAEVAPVVVIAGNHDNPARLEAVSPLLEMGRIVACSEPSAPDRGGVAYYEEMGIKIAMLPFISQRGIVRAEQIMGSDPDQHAGAYEERIKRLIDALTAGMTTDTVNLLAGHLTVHNAQEGGGERQAHIFGYAVPTSVFPGHLSHVALGHLHRQQKVPHGGSVWYSGSPLQLDFGEVDDRKGALLIEAVPGLPSKVTTVPLTSGRRLVTLTGSVDQVLARADEVEDAYVKVVLTEKARVGLADTVRMAIPGAVDVTLQMPTPTRPRAVESRRAISPTDAFHRYLEDNNVGDDRVEALFAELFDEATT
ncbi:MAG: exonuclease SbcCD subunit D [Acidimicrobiia bacterium]